MQRILALVLAILMVGSVVFTALYILLTGNIYAAEPADTDAADPAAPEEPVYEFGVPVDPTLDEKKILVGLMTGTNVTVGFETDSPYGFTVVKTSRLEAEYPHEVLWQLPDAKVSCVVDANLSKSAMTYSKTSDASKTVIGGWHVQIGSAMTSADVTALIAQIEPILNTIGVYSIPSYVSGGMCVRTGHFVNEELALSLAAKIKEAIPALEAGYAITVVGPSETGTALVNPLNDRILFEYDDADTTAVGLMAGASPDGSVTYMVTPAKKLYTGIFMFRRYIKGSTDGVSLTNIVSLGDYIKGVVPYEISSSWPDEAMKAFSICVRSYVLSLMGRHSKAYGVDVCNTAHCQVYSGQARTTDGVRACVDATAGMVVSYDNEILTTFYSAVCGGITINVEQAWDGWSSPAMVAVETPWEDYASHSLGIWKIEYTPYELAERLRSKGYTAIKGNIASVEIDQLATNSTYVYKVTLRDVYGNGITVKSTDLVRTVLGLYSANFVVGKGSVEADEKDFGEEAKKSEAAIEVRTALTRLPIAGIGAQTILTGSGRVSAPLQSTTVMTGSGPISAVEPDDGKCTVYASKPTSFIFCGKGWGHGVGISQIGIRDLARAGTPAAEILHKYFTDIEILPYDRLINP